MRDVESLKDTKMSFQDWKIVAGLENCSPPFQKENLNGKIF